MLDNFSPTKHGAESRNPVLPVFIKILAEIQQHMEEPTLLHNSCPMQWWCAHVPKYKTVIANQRFSPYCNHTDSLNSICLGKMNEIQSK